MNDQTRKALAIAAERMGFANYQQQLSAHIKAGRKRSTFRYHVTAEHAEVVAALGSASMTDDEAIGLLWQYDTMRQRLG